MRMVTVIAAVMLALALLSGCASKEYVASQTGPLDERLSKLEQAPKPVAPGQDVAVRAEDAAKKAEDAAIRAEAAAKRAEDAATRVEAAAQRIEDATKKAETSAKKSQKAFELMQKK